MESWLVLRARQLLKLTVHVEDDTLSAWCEDEEGSFSISMVLRQECYDGVVAGRPQHFIR